MKAILVLVLGVSLLGCDFSGYSSGPVAKALRHEVRENKQKEIDLAKVVPFKWDELFPFSPYTPRSEVCEALKLNDSECSVVVQSESKDDGEMFLVFRYKENIVHTEMYIRFNGDFLPLDFKQPVTPENAKFIVKERGKSANGEP